MAHELIRLLESAVNKPHLITEAALTPIVDYLINRTYSASFEVVKDAKTAEKKKAEMVGGIGEIPIYGTLTYKPVDGMCGPAGCSYQGILNQAEELISMGVSMIILTHSSGGGEATQAFATAEELKTLCAENDVKLISYIDTMAGSAAYLLACVADEVICHPEASAGSVGAMVALMDRSKALQNAGLKPIYITSTPGKVPIEPDGSFSEKFLEQIKSDVVRLGTKFAEHVSSNTGVDLETILGLDARMLHAEEALQVGLVNKIMNHRQFTAYIADLQGASNA